MKLSTASLLVLSAAAVNARFVEQHEKDQVVINGYTTDNEKYLLELAPGQTQWATEEEKWELRRVRIFYSHSCCTNNF
jgi:leucyl aminopeptidase